MKPEKLYYRLQCSSVHHAGHRNQFKLCTPNKVSLSVCKYLWRIFSASSLVMFRPRSARDCLISEESMRPVHTRTHLVNFTLRDSVKSHQTLSTHSYEMYQQKEATYHRCSCPSSWRWASASSHVPWDTWRTHWSPALRSCPGPQRKWFSAGTGRALAMQHNCSLSYTDDLSSSESSCRRLPVGGSITESSLFTSPVCFHFLHGLYNFLKKNKNKWVDFDLDEDILRGSFY